jgi:sugar-specific transcriptional regulator TrmB
MPKVEYALLNYDVDTKHPEYANFYAALRVRLWRLTLDDGFSTRLVNMAQVDSVIRDIEELKEHYGVPIYYRVRRTHPDEHEQLRRDSIKAFHGQIKRVVKEMKREIEKLEERLAKRTLDEEVYFKGRKAALRKADRLLREAKGLSMMFIIEQDVSDVLASIKKSVEAERLIQQDLEAKRQASKAALKRATG